MSHNRHHSVSFVDLIKRLPTRDDFDSAVKILQDRIGTNSQMGIVQMNNSIYAAKYIPTPTISQQREVLEEWELVRALKLLGYYQLYNDIQNTSMIIVQDYLPCDLLQYICNQNQFKTKHNPRRQLKKLKKSKSSKRLSTSKRVSFKTGTYPHLTEFESKQIAMNILQKLKKMHKYGFVHCDVKLQNIMKLTSLNKGKYNSTNDWRLIDFSLRTRYNINKGYSMNSWRGTIGWTAQELIPNNGNNNRIYPRSDIWSMGLVILYMVVGENPFELSVNECKENKLYTLESGKKYWYYNKLMQHKKNKTLNHYLMFLHKKNKISLDLLDLLLNHMLVFDVKKRSNVKTVLKHKWFKDAVKIKNINAQKKFVIGK